MAGEKIFIVDDDKDILNLIKDILNDENYIVTTAKDGKTAIEILLSKENFDLVILDIMLPDMDGYEILKKVRDKINAPIMFLSAKSKNMDKVIGFEIGADDYITKPFDDNELLARVKAHIRRQKRLNKNEDAEGIISYKGICINKNSYEVYLEDEKIELSTREFQILDYMMENPNLVLTREQIYNAVWNYGDFGDINTVTVHIKKLREKIDKDNKYIKTVWGIGYKFIGEKIWKASIKK